MFTSRPMAACIAVRDRWNVPGTYAAQSAGVERRCLSFPSVSSLSASPPATGDLASPIRCEDMGVILADKCG